MFILEYSSILSCRDCVSQAIPNSCCQIVILMWIHLSLFSITSVSENCHGKLRMLIDMDEFKMVNRFKGSDLDDLINWLVNMSHGRFNIHNVLQNPYIYQSSLFITDEFVLNKPPNLVCSLIQSFIYGYPDTAFNPI